MNRLRLYKGETKKIGILLDTLTYRLSFRSKIAIKSEYCQKETETIEEKVLIKATTAAGLEPEDAEGRQNTNATISGHGYRESLVKHEDVFE